MSLTPVEIAAYVGAGLLGASKLFSAFKPLWNKLPRWASVLLPVLVVSLPQVAAAAGGVTTETSLVTWALTSVALLLPGMVEAEEAPAAPAS